MDKKFEYYKDFCYEYFNSVLGVINKINYPGYLTVLDYSYVSFCTGDTVFPCNINIYLGNIFKVTKTHDEICTLIVLTITHELYHLEQVVNSDKFNSDEKYSMFIECNVQRKAFEFIEQNKFIIESMFHFTLQDMNQWNGYTKKVKKEYKEYGNIKDFYIYQICSTFSELDINDKKFRNQLNKIFDKYIHIGISINGNNFYIKKNNIYLLDSIEIYIYYIDKYCSNGRYIASLNMGVSKIDKNFFIIDCKLEPQLSSPFLSEDSYW